MTGAEQLTAEALQRDGASPSSFAIALTAGVVSVAVGRNPRARRYILRLRPDGSARLTIPRHGSVAEGRRFAERQAGWLERALRRVAARPARTDEWKIGTEIFFRGTLSAIEAGSVPGAVRVGSETILLTNQERSLRSAIEDHLRRWAEIEIPPKVFAFAARHQLTVNRVTVRNQKSRWGSCSRRGTLSLNWRLIQTPDLVQDYVILHELAHLKEMNHSTRFWNEVERICPGYRLAESWLKQYAALLRS